MKFVACFMSIALLTASPSLAVETRFMQGIGDTRYQRIDSDIIGRSYHLFIMLPDGYDESVEQRYPTVYMLDGGALFPLLSAYSRYLRIGREIPDAILVGISYGSASFEGGNFRSTDYTAKSLERDYWGGAEKFQRFFSDELLPTMEQSYRMRPDRRVVFGHSIGGQFVLYTALTKPDLFWGHIASNPALHRNLPFFLQQHGKAAEAGEQPRLFVGSGSMDDPQYRVPAREWIQHWSTVDDKPWLLKISELEGHTHGSAPPASFRRGMGWLFSKDE
ncbi:MAG: alpha/beta hydrolase-fold protein [Woeseiaceae bacterium]|nr:alpha/beta hydrolase-fold protein [Woeseiaceae bacterium]